MSIFLKIAMSDQVFDLYFQMAALLGVMAIILVELTVLALVMAC